MSQDKMREAFEAWANNYPALEDDHGYVNLRYLGLHKQYVDFDVQRAWQAYQAGHASAAPAPAGCVLVPIEPTQQMCQEGQWKAQEWPRFPLRIVPIWKAMLAAAKA